MNTIFKKIQESFDLLDLQKNWDGIGASPVNKMIYIQTVEYMLKIAINIDEDINNLKIEACPDGSIDIKFQAPKAQLNIKVNKNGISYEATGSHKEDEMKIINSSYGYVSSDVIEWLNRNFRK